MASSRLRGPLGGKEGPSPRTPGPLGHHDAGHPDAHPLVIGDTPGPLGWNDWADPDEIALQCLAPIMSYLRPPVKPIVSQFPPWWKPHVRRKFLLPKGVPTGHIDDPPWIKYACWEEEVDIHEFSGLEDNNPRILEYIATVPRLAQIKYKYSVKYLDKKTKKKLTREIDSGKMMSEVDETAWCACFVNWCLMKANMSPPGYSRAKDWRKYGTSLDPKDLKLGAVAVIFHKPTAATANMTHSGWHVGFYIGGPSDHPVLLGGNQSDMVCRKQVKGDEIFYRWPTAPPERKK
jgi:uncharacterized protein (TIGR02594 family)